ncbi:VASt domain-containing protein [Caenorhabditis elegans]|uniref:VASt domain-containing protein n=1 Tax=Caenorhabditis elegans TaxID=6239 RepID=Q9U249_CAEEL|nr:VASt domain-containing protein [Caenorhabditis elegans]CAB60412.2 VASt domain-containing protein [Caenorhabditis elegans]
MCRDFGEIVSNCAYFVVCVYLRTDRKFSLDCVIRSPTKMNHMKFDFVPKPREFYTNSLHEAFVKYGKAEKFENEQLIFYTWEFSSNHGIMFMVENHMNRFVSVKGSQDETGYEISQCFLQFETISPKSRHIVGGFYCEYWKTKCNVKLEYTVSRFAFAPFYWLDRYLDYLS